MNISTRLPVQNGDNALIGGFIVSGSHSKKVVLRGLGPSLTGSGVANPLSDPVIRLHDSSSNLVASNDDWQDTQRTQIEGTPFQPTNDREAVIITTLAPGAYTVILSGKNGATGVGLVEIYDDNLAQDSQLANISTRGMVQTADNVMIGGFILGGHDLNAHVVIRGLGPSLSQFGLSNVLADPFLELRDQNGALLQSNNNWQDDPVAAAELQADGLAPTNDNEAAMTASLPAGAYTTILSGHGGGTGLGLVEVYHIP